MPCLASFFDAMSGVKKLTKVHVVSDYTTLACHPSDIKRCPDEVAEDLNEASFAEVGQVITGVKFGHGLDYSVLE